MFLNLQLPNSRKSAFTPFKARPQTSMNRERDWTRDIKFDFKFLRTARRRFADLEVMQVTNAKQQDTAPKLKINFSLKDFKKKVFQLFIICDSRVVASDLG